MLAGAGAVAADALAPLVKHIAPGVAVAGRLEVADLERAGIEHVAAGGTEVAKRSPGRLDRRAHRHPLEHVKQTARAHLEGAARVMRVFRGEAVEQVHDPVGLVVAVGVGEPEHPRLVHHQHAAGEELKARRTVELVEEDGALVGPPVAVGVFEDHELVGRLGLARLPLRIARHRCDPEPALGVEGQLHGVGELGKLPLVGKEPQLVPLRHRAGLDELLGREDHRPPLGVLAVGLPRLTEPGRGLKELARGRVVGHRRHRPAGRDLVNIRVAHRRHGAELQVFPREGLRVKGAAAAVDIPAIDHPVVLDVDPRLVDNRGAKRRERLG